jgi:hypothetical protein
MKNPSPLGPPSTPIGEMANARLTARHGGNWDIADPGSPACRVAGGFGWDHDGMGGSGAGGGGGGWQGFLDQGGLMGHLEEALGTWGCWGCEGWFGGRGGRGYIER